MADAYGHLRLWRCEEVGVGESDVVWALLGYFSPRPVARPDRRFRSTRASYFDMRCFVSPQRSGRPVIYFFSEAVWLRCWAARRICAFASFRRRGHVKVGAACGS